MGRKIKSGIDQFPLDVVFDKNVRLIKAKYGIYGIGLLISLLQNIYANSYYIHCDEECLLLFKLYTDADIDLINNFVSDCLQWGIFCDYLYEKHGILTSHEIQTNFFARAKRRKKMDIDTRYLLIGLSFQ